MWRQYRERAREDINNQSGTTAAARIMSCSNWDAALVCLSAAGAAFRR